MAVARGYDTERQALPQSCGGRLGDHSGCLGHARAIAHEAGAGWVGQPGRQEENEWGEVRPGARVEGPLLAPPNR